MTGKSFTPQAVTVVQDYAAGLSDVSGDMDETTDSAKKLEKTLSVLSFDQLNQLSPTNKDEPGSGSGAGSGAGGANELLPSEMFATVPIEQKYKHLPIR